jgi:hypothetical protein
MRPGPRRSRTRKRRRVGQVAARLAAREPSGGSETTAYDRSSVSVYGRRLSQRSELALDLGVRDRALRPREPCLQLGDPSSCARLRPVRGRRRRSRPRSLLALVARPTAEATSFVYGKERGDRPLELLVLERCAPSPLEGVRRRSALAPVLGRQNVGGGRRSSGGESAHRAPSCLLLLAHAVVTVVLTRLSAG